MQKVGFLTAAAALLGGLQAAARVFPGDFAELDRRRTGRSRNDLKPGQGARVYPTNSTRAMERRKRQMAKAEAKAGAKA